jgi:hypothetical protein
MSFLPMQAAGMLKTIGFGQETAQSLTAERITTVRFDTGQTLGANQGSRQTESKSHRELSACGMISLNLAWTSTITSKLWGAANSRACDV